jgi:hypothetical protein
MSQFRVDVALRDDRDPLQQTQTTRGRRAKTAPSMSDDEMTSTLANKRGSSRHVRIVATPW